MCNAWNHPASCTCGWGGYGHLGRRSAGNEYSAFVGYAGVPPIARARESYVNPNASCPVCGAHVYFYQSPHGGRVFFDELGPPWPKHPCTDNDSLPKVRAQPFGALVKNVSPTYRWQKEGWSPFFIATVSRIDKFLIKISGTLDGEEISVYFKSVLSLHGRSTDLTNECLAHIRGAGEGRYEISAITVRGTEVNYKAYVSQISARNGEEPKWPGRRAGSARENPRADSKKSRDNRPHTSKDHISKPKETTMSAAFEKALKAKKGDT